MSVSSHSSPRAVALPAISKRFGIPLPVTVTGTTVKILESRYEDQLVGDSPELKSSAAPLPISSVRGLVPLRVRWRRIVSFLFRRKGSSGLIL